MSRLERDSLGEMRIAESAYYGIQTMRAIENFPVSGIKAHPLFVESTAVVKQAAAIANMKTGMLDKTIGNAVVAAAREIEEGMLRDEFVVDVYQAGAGTSHNMNANEVIANRAIEIMGGSRGDYTLVHPNDHVNMSQSTNDTYPTAMRLALLMMLEQLLPAADRLRDVFYDKSVEYRDVVKSARTHLQDAVPITAGQEFAGYAASLSACSARLRRAGEDLCHLGIGGTAAGTGLGSHPCYREEVLSALKSITGRGDLVLVDDFLAASSSMACFQHISSVTAGLSIELGRISNDIRLLSSGPRTGLSELILPAVQPGSSIMPGKLNPVMAEMLNMVCFQVQGNDLAVSLACQAGQLQLNVMMPVINYNLLSSMEILKNAVNLFRTRCVDGIKVNKERCVLMAEVSLGMATALNRYIGYEAAAKVAGAAEKEGVSIREMVKKMKILGDKEAKDALDILSMTKGQCKR